MKNNVFTDKHAILFIEELMKIFEEKFEIKIDYKIKERNEENEKKTN